jgi:hypothetical protein
VKQGFTRATKASGHPTVTVLTVWAGVFVDQEYSMIAYDVAHLAHNAQLLGRQEVMQGEADPCDIRRLGAVLQCLNEIAVVQPDRTCERLKSLARQLQRRFANVYSVIKGGLLINNPALVERHSRRNLVQYCRYVRAFSNW